MAQGWSAIDTNMGVKPSPVTRVAAVVRTRDRNLLREYGGVAGIIRALDTDSENGILGDADDIKARTEIFGTNFARHTRRPTLVKGFQICAQMAINCTNISILFLLTIVSLCFGVGDHGMKLVCLERRTGLFYLLALVIASAMMNFWLIRVFSAPDHNSLDYDSQVEVVRNCGWMKIPSSRVVVGDVVFLKPGDQVPADGLFMDGHSFNLENVINGTGKPRCEEVGHENPFISSGSMVLSGYSRMVVTAVGENQPGENCKNQLRKQNIKQHVDELQNLTATIGRFGNTFGLSTFAWLLYSFYTKQIGGGGQKEADIIELQIAILGVFSASVIIIPLALKLKGLVSVVKSTLAYTVRSLLNDHVLIKNPDIYHHVASVDTICLSKTGTLTSDSSEVVKFWLGLTSMEQVSHHLIAPNVLGLLHQAIGLNTTQPRLSSTFESSLNLTERAIYTWATIHLGMKMESLRQSCTILETEPFNPIIRRSGVLISKNNAIHVHRKGAADLILSMCSHYYESIGSTKAIDSSTRAQLGHIVQGMEKDGLRCIAFALRKTTIEEYFNLSKQKLTLLGLVGIKNPVRTRVKRAVKDCQKAGIAFKLLTGDSSLTATFLAVRGGLLDNVIQPGQVVEGKEFRDFTPEERMAKVYHIRILAKATPSDKLLMVESLKKKGLVVAYVGGGQGDKQALEEADVGICFGTRGGAEILKACSDIVMKKKDFPLVVEILNWGRGFYDKTETYAQFLLTATFVNLVVNFVMVIFPSNTVTVTSIAQVPMPVLQLVWVKLTLNTVAALSVLIKQPSDDLMSMPARDPNEPLMTDGMQRNIIAQALYQIVVLLTIHFRGSSLLNLNPYERNTAIFNTYVLCQVFTLINAKKNDQKNIFQEIHNKKWLWGIIGIMTVLQVIMVEVWSSIAGTARLDARQWGLCIFIAAASNPISWLLWYSCPMNIPFLNSIEGSSLKYKV